MLLDFACWTRRFFLLPFNPTLGNEISPLFMAMNPFGIFPLDNPVMIGG
jgi:hypothetical protein